MFYAFNCILIHAELISIIRDDSVSYDIAVRTCLMVALVFRGYINNPNSSTISAPFSTEYI